MLSPINQVLQSKHSALKSAHNRLTQGAGMKGGFIESK